DSVLESKVVQSVVAPSEEQPFRHVGVKWRLHNNARDFVCVEATGFATSSKGEQVGFSISHSVAFSQIPSFDKFGVERANMSLCCLFHQKTPELVECYARGFYDFRSDSNELMNSLSVNAVATQWLSVSRIIECAEMKKLVWRLRKNSGLPQRTDDHRAASFRVIFEHGNPLHRAAATYWFKEGDTTTSSATMMYLVNQDAPARPASSDDFACMSSTQNSEQIEPISSPTKSTCSKSLASTSTA
ncbi:hypothetical protein PHYSODRAFT_248070, partial [Phytophthora sojae]